MSRNKHRISLRHSVLSVACAIMLAVLAFNVLYIFPRQESTLADTVRGASEQSLKQLSTILHSPLLKHELALVHETIDAELQANPSWKRIRLTNGDGLQLYPLDAWQEEYGDDDLIIDVFIDPDQPATGQLRLVLDLSAAMARSRALFLQLAAFQLVLMLLTLGGIVWFINRSIVAPLVRLNAAFSAIAQGEFEAGLPDSPHREIASTIEEFKHTRSAIKAYQQNLEKLRIQAEAANLAKTGFLSRMSHELRTPLNSILGFSELLLSRQATPGAEREQLAAIQYSGRHLLNLITEILDYANTELTATGVTLLPVGIADLFRQCSMQTAPLAAKHGIRVQFSKAEPLALAVMANPRRLLQVLLNVLANAVKYNRPQGSVTVQACASGQGRVVIEVRDTGSGMSSTELERIFRPFERLERHLDTEGAGIGLSLSRELMTIMNGSLSAESVPGEGSIFRLELQSAALPEPAPGALAAVAPGARSEHGGTTSALQVLVVEDNAVNRMVIKSQLGLLGHRCTLAADGREALALLQGQEFDLVLTDIMMPVMDGMELARNIRASTRDSHQHLPIIALSASASEQDKARARACGIDHYLTKPLTLDELQAVLNRQT